MKLSCAIDTTEGRHIAVTDITGASYMQIWTNKYICSWRVK